MDAQVSPSTPSPAPASAPLVAPSPLSPVATILETLREGKPVIVMDDENRENEGDLIMAAQFATPATVAFIIRHSTGILCTAMPQAWADQLALPRMVQNNTDLHSTAFTVTCDHLDAGTGVSAAHRALTIRALADPSTTPSQLRRPGHIFPLIARPGGILERRGHTEATVDLCRLAGLRPVGLLSEICDDQGNMMRFDACVAFGQQFNIPITTIEHLVQYRKDLEGFSSTLTADPKVEQWRVEQVAQCVLPVQFEEGKYLGNWVLRVFVSLHDRCQHVVLVKGDLDGESGPVLTRIHSECFTGNTLGSMRCDCGPQLQKSMEMIEKEGRGIVLYVAGHEGRGIGLINKIKAYHLQTQDLIDTYQANCALGFPEDMRDYTSVLSILGTLGVKQIDLITNNPEKLEALKHLTRSVRPLVCPPNEHNKEYLEAKKRKQAERIQTLNVPVAVTAPQEEPSAPDMLPLKSTLNIPSPEVAKTLRIGIISTSWNKQLVEPMLEDCVKTLCQAGVRKEHIFTKEVPGCFELPVLAQMVAQSGLVDAILCIGILLKGETLHFELLSQSVVSGLMKVQLKTGVPILNGVMNCLTLSQAEQRCVGTHSLAPTLVLSALQMAGLRKSFIQDFMKSDFQISHQEVLQPCTNPNTEQTPAPTIYNPNLFTISPKFFQPDLNLSRELSMGMQ
uniref:GTP cyclohydrolase II domain-containing protein n=1 Tax=Arcella intermedia TaxID=1963864 RepID=A0A6B2KZ31_9EUKA